MRISEHTPQMLEGRAGGFAVVALLHRNVLGVVLRALDELRNALPRAVRFFFCSPVVSSSSGSDAIRQWILPTLAVLIS